MEYKKPPDEDRNLLNFISVFLYLAGQDCPWLNESEFQTDLRLTVKQPTNISDCETSNYCNRGKCVLVPDPVLQETMVINIINKKISCQCFKPFVDSSDGFCTKPGKSKLMAFILLGISILLISILLVLGFYSI